ncbi:uncharacterized protein [Blastocystis hominis]|uniref:Uncharacterized protein n=1 Tax=Blastocystis hominis TaxID=12968 RepID=D8M5N0_BLAHO|nr:uncharacterized protein [Blastocystis hominis]CBK23369.2 unnamed protein product [Blastocystis hominis]|eukprot:XP_012897417.1 uncharacterized protein [Blastocystis hominis]
MFSKRSTSVEINKYLDTYQQNEVLPSKTYRSLNSAFIKATKKKEDEVTKKLEEGNKEDHSRHEEYLLSFIDEPLKTQIYSYINRGLEKCHTIAMLKKVMKEKSYFQFLEAIKKCVKRIYVQPNMLIYDPSNPTAADSLVLIFLRHGEGYYVENDVRNTFESLECVDMLGVTDHCFVNDKELSCDRVKIVSNSACLVGIVNMLQIISTVKTLNTSKEEIDNVVSILLARSLRIEQERAEQEHQKQLQEQEALRHQLAEWKDYLMAGNLEKVRQYINNGFDVNADIGINRNKPLFYGVMSKSEEVVRSLCASGANLQEQNEDGFTALHFATKVNWIEGIGLLLKLGATMMPDNAGNYPTHIAAQDGNNEALLYYAKLQKEGNTRVGDRLLPRFEVEKTHRAEGQ